MVKSANAFIVVVSLAVLPTVAYAQGSSITGTVKDSSGAVLPGVTVEAASPVLIEKVRSAVTDAAGQYRIVELRTGTYTVTFTLTGFSTVRREGFEVPADFVSTLNIDLKVGALEETVTVTGESPIVDIQSARRQRTLNTDMIEALPTAQGYSALIVLMPSMIVSGGGNNNVQLTTGMIVFGGRGGRGNEGIAQTDGIGTGAAINGGGVSGYGRLDTSEEVVLTSTGGLGEAEVGGPIVNLVPRTGGNTFQNRYQGSDDGRDAEQQLHAGVERCRPEDARHHQLSVGHEPVERRADQEGSALVLLRNAVPGERERCPRHVLQQERRRPDQVDVRGGSGPPRPGQFLGRGDADPAPDGAGHAPEQVEPVLGRGWVQVQQSTFGRLPHVGARNGYGQSR